MTLGVIMLVHAPFGRAADVVRFWVQSGVPVVLHIDRKTPKAEAEAFQEALRDLSQSIRYSKRFSTRWGSWNLVEASLDAARVLLDAFPEVERVLLSSGSCLPLRPAAEFEAFLAERPGVEIIESARTSEVPWTIGGLSKERFQLYFPFSWRANRRLFDWGVRVQRRLKVKRRIPQGLDPHLGAQWWCLTRQTLMRILTDPDLRMLKSYFRKVWIPDESFFQSLVRRYRCKVESTSLTLAKFDKHGKPAIFYDDHLELLRRSNCFMARKIWPQADALYEAFLRLDAPVDLARGAPNPGRIDRLFSQANQQRDRGRAGLYMQSRFPRKGREKGMSAAPYSVFEGFDQVFANFEYWLQRRVEARVHGHLFAPERVEFAGRTEVFRGGLSDSAAIRDYNPGMFLTNLLWNARGEQQVFFYGPHDTQKVSEQIAQDANASVYVVSGAWILPLLQENLPLHELRRRAARLQSIEDAHLADLKSSAARAKMMVWTLADVLRHPRAALQEIFLSAGLPVPQPKELPALLPHDKLEEALQTLRNLGMHPYLVGDAGILTAEERTTPKPKPYFVE